MFTNSPYQRSIRPILAEFGIQAPDILLNELVLDSREVAIHSGFVALKGHAKDGRDFIPQAVSLGAKVILAETEQQSAHGNISMREQSLLIDFYQLAQCLSALAAHFYQWPSEQLHTAAVTGTNGKTSTVQLSAQLSALLNKNAGSIGTLGVKVHQRNQEQNALSLHNTTPDAISMQRLLRQMRDNDIGFCAFEASSHALVQSRIRAVHTNVAVFTNLSRDHLDYHGSMAEYAAAKRLLLQQPDLQWLVLNADDKESQRWFEHRLPQQQVIWVSLKGKPQVEGKVCYADSIRYLPSGFGFEVHTSWGSGTVRTSLIGAFNISNLLSAIAVQLALGCDFSSLLGAVNEVRPIAGRMELFSSDKGVSALVDYAHTPDALRQALQAARRHCLGQLWCVFGCGGERDQGKRPLMGEVAETYADRLVLTNDNSRTEDPQVIAQDILNGVVAPEKVQIELDRKKAIALALQQAQEGDVILIAGKGHEDYQMLDGQRVDYDERYYVKQLFVENTPC